MVTDEFVEERIKAVEERTKAVDKAVENGCRTCCRARLCLEECFNYRINRGHKKYGVNVSRHLLSMLKWN